MKSMLLAITLIHSLKREAKMLISLFHTYLQKEITLFFSISNHKIRLFLSRTFTSTYLVCSLVRYVMHSCSQFL